MGYMRHNAIIITLSDEVAANSLLQRIKAETTLPTSGVVESNINNYYSLCVFPDGSKEGWEASHEGDIDRDHIITILKDSSFYCPHWVEVQYGDDDGVTKIIRHDIEELEEE